MTTELQYEDGCPTCGGAATELGTLGRLTHFRCRNCGGDWHVETAHTAAVYNAESSKLVVNGQSFQDMAEVAAWALGKYKITVSIDPEEVTDPQQACKDLGAIIASLDKESL